VAEHSHEAGMAGESALLLFWWRVNWKCVQAAVSASVGWGRALRNAPRTPFPLPEVLSPVCVSSVPCWKMLKMLLEGEPSRLWCRAASHAARRAQRIGYIQAGVMGTAVRQKTTPNNRRSALSRQTRAVSIRA